MADPAPTDEAAAQPADGASAAPPRGLWGFTPTLALTLAVVMLLILALVGWAVSNQHSANNRHAATSAQSGYLAGPAAIAAETAASNETRATLTYNYQHLAADFAAAEKGMTPAFSATYRTTTAQKVTPLATRYHAVSTAIVSDAGVSAITATTATVLLFVDQTVTNSQLAHPRLDRSRDKVTLAFSAGRWLITGITPL
jgi:Mce-associated membrane protein